MLLRVISLRQLNIGRRRAFLTKELEDVEGHTRDCSDASNFGEEVRGPDEFPIC